jgi:hypothetical protein
MVARDRPAERKGRVVRREDVVGGVDVLVDQACRSGRSSWPIR